MPLQSGSCDATVTPELNDDFRDMLLALDEAWSTRVAAKVAGLDFAVLGRDALIKNKRAAGRDKDLVDARAIEERAARKPA